MTGYFSTGAGGAVLTQLDALKALFNGGSLKVYVNGNLQRTVAATGNMSATTGAFTIGGNSIFTFRSTARLRLPNGTLSDMSRTVGATIKYHAKPKNTPRVEMLRWYDN